MMKRKEVLLVFILMLFSSGICAQQPSSRLFVAIDGFAPALKIGLERKVSERISWKASAGFCIAAPPLLSWNLFGTCRITNPAKPFGMSISFGLLDNYIVIPESMVSLGAGAGIGVSRRFRNRSELSFRLGMITGPSFSKEETSLLTLPNYSLEFAFPLRK